MSIFDVSSFKEFYKNLFSLSNKKKGEIFEEFASYFFPIKLNVKYWRLKEVPSSLLQKLNLPSRDVGIDAIYEDQGEYFGVQVKYRSRSTLCYGGLGTFFSLFAGRAFKAGVVISSARKIGVMPYIGTEIIPISYHRLVEECDEEFWKNLNRLRQKKVFFHVPKQPRPFQEEILASIGSFFSRHNKGRLISACGTGKTLLGLWTAQRLNSQRTLILVPSLVLLRQTYDVWKRELPRETFLLIGTEKEVPDGVLVTTNPIEINLSSARVVICTYHSSHLLQNLFFSLILYDEAHHTKQSKQEEIDTYFSRSLQLNSFFKLFLTATGEELDEERHGPIIYEYSLQRAIADKVLTDYRVVICMAEEETEAILEEGLLINYENKVVNPSLLKGMTMIEKAAEEFLVQRLIVYSNRRKTAAFVADKIKLPYFHKSLLTSKEKGNQRCAILEEFANSDKALLSSVRVIKEGLDIDRCDSICFMEPRWSRQDIIQCIGRALRKEHNKKLAYILIPVVWKDLYSYCGKEYKNVVAVLSCLAGQDKELEEKIIVRSVPSYSINFKQAKVKKGCDIDINSFKRGLLLNVLSKRGEGGDRVLLQRENERRKSRGERLLVNRRECCNFLGEKKEVDNWIKYALTPTMYREIFSSYYSTIEEFVQACQRLGINNSNYEELAYLDKKLPPYNYLEAGMYKHLDKDFNLTLLLSNEEEW